MQMKCCMLFEEVVRGFFQQVFIRSAKKVMLCVEVYFYLWFWSLLGPSHKRIGLFIIFTSL